MKPGYQTTEFWLHLGVHAMGFLVLFGFVTADDAKSLGDSWAKAVAAVFTIAAQVLNTIHYLGARSSLKQTAMQKGVMSPTSITGFGGMAIVLALLFAPASFADS